MSLDNNNKFCEPSLRLLIKYLGQKYCVKGFLTKDELEYLRNIMCLNEITFQTVLHTFNQETIGTCNQLTKKPFLGRYSQYLDISHELWGRNGLCGKNNNLINNLINCKPLAHVRLDRYKSCVQYRTNNRNFRKASEFNVPWLYNCYGGNYEKLRKECVFVPVIKSKVVNGRSIVSGLYVRVDKLKVFKFIKKYNMYGQKINNTIWGTNINFKHAMHHISSKMFKNTNIKKDMKLILTPVVLNNDDPLPNITVPERITNVSLKKYQLANVEWMHNLENNLESKSITVPETNEIMPNIHYNHINEIVYEQQQPNKKWTPKGGGLFDKVGLGKTLTCITLIAMNPADNDIGCKHIKTQKGSFQESKCEAYIKSGKRVKENGGKPIKCGRIIKISKTPKTPKSKNGTSTQNNNIRSLECLLKHRVCAMHGRSIKEDNTIKKKPHIGIHNHANIKKKNNLWMSRATLIICPNQIPDQWLNQVRQYTTPILNVFIIRTVNDLKKLTYADIINADMVITTIACFERGTVTSLQSMTPHTNDTTQTNNNIKLTDQPSFDLIWWHRVMFDEMHEITNKKFKRAASRIFKIKSTYKWSVTGTPFNTNQLNYDIIVSWLYDDNKLNSQSRYRIFDKLQSHSDILQSLFRRNTKESTAHLTSVDCNTPHEKLWQTVTQTEVWLEFSPIERAMYSARNASKPSWIKSRNDEHLRQICCHPNLNAENSNIVHAIHNSSKKKRNRFAVDSKNVKKALIDHTKSLIENMLTDNIPRKIQSSWNAKKTHLLDKTNKKTSMAYYGSVHQVKRAFLKLYQLRKAYRAYTDIYNTDNTHIIITVCDGCKLNIQVQTEDITIHIGECGHIFCEKCCKRKFASPFVNLSDTQITINKYDDTKITNTKKPQKTPKVYEKKIIDGYAKCQSCDNTNCSTIGMISTIKVDPRELMMDIHSTSNELGNDNCIDSVNSDEKNFIPHDFKDEMECAIGLYGTKIANLVAYLKTYTSNPHNQRIIIFSQWDNLLQGIMKTLNNFDLPAMMCKGNVYQKRKAVYNFKNNNYYKIILLSSKYAASGLDLIEANKIIFIDPIYGNFETVYQVEDQAIGRAHRLGQQKPVEVVRFLIKNTIEEECFKDWQKVKGTKNHISDI